MKYPLLLLSAFAASAFAPSGLAAGSEPVPIDPANPALTGKQKKAALDIRNRTRRDAAKFANCVVKRRADLARDAVIGDVHEIKGHYRKLLDPECLKSEEPDSHISKMSFPGDTFHDALADALVRLAFRQQGPTTFTDLPPYEPYGFQRWTEADLEKLSPTDRERALEYQRERMAWIFMDEVGDCTSRRSPEGVRKLALTEVTTDEERLELRSLLPHVQACVPQGVTFKLSMGNIRGPLVRSYYRLALKKTVPTSPPVKS